MKPPTTHRPVLFQHSEGALLCTSHHVEFQSNDGSLVQAWSWIAVQNIKGNTAKSGKAKMKLCLKEESQTTNPPVFSFASRESLEWAKTDMKSRMEEAASLAAIKEPPTLADDTNRSDYRAVGIDPDCRHPGAFHSLEDGEVVTNEEDDTLGINVPVPRRLSFGSRVNKTIWDQLPPSDKAKILKSKTDRPADEDNTEFAPQHQEEQTHIFSSSQNAVDPPVPPVAVDAPYGTAALVPSKGGRSKRDLEEGSTSSNGEMAKDVKLPPINLYCQDQTKQIELFSIVCLFVVIVLAVGLVVGLQLNPPSSPQPAPTTELPTIPPLTLDNLPDYTLRSLEDPSSSQSQAYAWLVDHPKLDSLAEWRKLQLFAMAGIFYELNGPSWSPQQRENWLNYTGSECSWAQEEFICGEQGNLETIYIKEAPNQIGTMPAEVSFLTSLETLMMPRRNIAASFPELLSIVSKLPLLKRWGMIENVIWGNIPSQISDLTALELANLSGNSLSGTIPSELGHLTKLSFLSLSHNSLTGQIPSELGRLTKLEYLSLQKNELVGSIPLEICGLSSLQTLELDCAKVDCPVGCPCLC